MNFSAKIFNCALFQIFPIDVSGVVVDVGGVVVVVVSEDKAANLKVNINSSAEFLNQDIIIAAFLLDG